MRIEGKDSKKKKKKSDKYETLRNQVLLILFGILKLPFH